VRLQVAMQDFAVVTVFEGEANLREVVKNFVLCERVSTHASLFNLVVEFTVIRVLHHYVKIEFLVLEDVLELNDVGVVKNLQNTCLIPRSDSFVK